jgi:hypothetical protein
MADLKISELNEAINLEAMHFAAIQSGDNKKVPAELLAPARSVKEVDAATYELLPTDYILHVVRTATGDCGITIPTAQTVAGRVIHVKDAGFDASTNNITIETEGAEEIEGAANLVISADGVSISLYSDGTDWFIF